MMSQNRTKHVSVNILINHDAVGPWFRCGKHDHHNSYYYLLNIRLLFHTTNVLSEKVSFIQHVLLCKTGYVANIQEK